MLKDIIMLKVVVFFFFDLAQRACFLFNLGLSGFRNSHRVWELKLLFNMMLRLYVPIFRWNGHVKLSWKWITNPGARNSEFGCKSYELFHFSSIKFIFHVIIEELLDAAMWLKLPKGWRAWYQKNNLFYP
jgi:hypothetical protein